MPVGFYTLDVGHGLCQVILFSGGRAVLIDGGGAFAKVVPASFLSRFVKVIVAYVATHNDSDHVGAAIHLLDAYPTRAELGAIWLVMDRGSNSRIRLLEYCKQRKREKTIGDFRFAYLHSPPGRRPRPRAVYTDKAENASLDLLYPTFEDVTDSARAKTPDAPLQNRAGACLRLTVGEAPAERTALITGDIDCVGLTTICREYGFDLHADLLTVPHHAGHIPANADCLTWDQIIELVDPDLAIVSAGWRPEGRTKLQRKSLDPLVRRGVSVCCTQLTECCHAAPQSFYPSVLTAQGRALSQMSGRPEPQFGAAVACFGSIYATFRSDGSPVSVQYLSSHQRGVNERVQPGGSPFCREVAAAPAASAAPTGTQSTSS